MSVEKIIADWKKGKFKPVYLFHGEESYFIDQLIDFAENNIIKPEEADFNKTIFYGKDTDWVPVVTACRRHPMFADKQLVMIKEAQSMNSIEKLETYLESPLASTILIIAHKGKTIDKRTKLFKLLDKNGEIFISTKIQDYKIHDWISEYVSSVGMKISSKSVSLLQENIGNDLGRIVTEIEKLKINLGDKKTIDEDVIEKYIGISKEYNIFELQAAIATKNLSAAIKIINYFERNPKSAPIQMALPALYTFISKVYAVYGLSNKSEFALKPLFYNNSFAVAQATTIMNNYGYSGIEKLILLLHHYNMKSLGVGDSATEDAALMKEMVAKMVVG